MAQQQGFWGNAASTGNSSIQAFAIAEITEYHDNSASVRYGYSAYVDYGDWYQTIFNFSWLNSGQGGQAKIGGPGWWADGGWIYADVAYGDYVTISGNLWRQGGGYESTVSGYYYPAAPVWAPNAPTNAVNTRNSDTKNTITWTRNVTGARQWSKVYIERSVNGGGFAALTSVAGTATSYADTACAVDKYYQYRVYAKNDAGASGYATSGITYNTPAAPGKPSGAREGQTQVKVSIPNTSVTATATEIQRSNNASAWTTIVTTTNKATSYTDNPGGGTWYYRARNKRGNLASPWSATSDAVVTICPPAAPTITSPLSGITIKTGQAITVTWQHNPIDGSAQSAAQVQYSTNTETWTTLDVTTAQTATITNNFAANTTLYIRVRTKGVHADYSPYSANVVVSIKQVPSVSITEPAGEITAFPVTFKASYSDVSGSLNNLHLTITNADNVKVFERDLGTSTTYTIQVSELSLVDGQSYTWTVKAISTSGLDTTATKTVAVSFTPPKRAEATITDDTERAEASVVCVADNTDTGEAVVSLALYRERDGVRVLLGAQDGTSMTVVDRYAPINTEYAYVVVSYAASGASKERRIAHTITSSYTYFYFKNSIAKALYNPEEAIDLKRSGRSLVQYAGRTYPVLYDSGAIDETRSFSGVLKTRAEAETFKALMHEGFCVFKSLYGDVLRAAVDVSLSPAYVADLYGNVSVSITRIDGDAL